MYGKGLEARNVATDPVAITKALMGRYGRNQLFRFSVGEESVEHLAIARQVDIHPVTRKLRHVDLYVVNPDTPIKVSVPIRLVGRSAGQKVGGRLAVHRREVVVACTPATLPASIDVELAPYNAGEGIGVEDLRFPTGVVPVYRKAFRVFDIMRAKVEVAATDADDKDA